VERLERGDLPLDEALKIFERGVVLTRQLPGLAPAAQQKGRDPPESAVASPAASIEPFEEASDEADGAAPDPQ